MNFKFCATGFWNKNFKKCLSYVELAKCHSIVVSESEPEAGEEGNDENDDSPQTPKSRKIGTCLIYKHYVVKRLL